MILLPWAVASLGCTLTTVTLEVLKGDIIERSCNYQCVLVPQIAEAIPALFLAIVRSLPESRCRHA